MQLLKAQRLYLTVLNNLQIVHQMWERNDVKGVIAAMDKMSDHAISTLQLLSSAYHNWCIDD